MATRTGSPTDLDREFDDHRGRSEVVAPLYITVAQAARSLPPGRNGRPTHFATVIRWITTGTTSPAGEAVRLQAVRMGGRWLTTHEWLADYARRLTPAFDRTAPTPTPATRTRSAERAGRELDAIGIRK
jgi:hypothetical protein